MLRSLLEFVLVLQLQMWLRHGVVLFPFHAWRCLSRNWSCCFFPRMSIVGFFHDREEASSISFEVKPFSFDHEFADPLRVYVMLWIFSVEVLPVADNVIR